MSFRKRGVAQLCVALLISVTVACSSPSQPREEADPLVALVDGIVHDSSAVTMGRDRTPPTDSVAYEGVLAGSAAIEVFLDDRGWIALGDAADVDLVIYCTDAAVLHADASVPIGTVSRVRLTLDRFEARVDAGAVIGGVRYDRAFVISFGEGGPVVVEKGVEPFALTVEAHPSLTFDLNTELWVDAAVVEAGRVSAEAIAGAATLQIR